MDMCLYESVSCVCLCLSDEPVLFCIYVRIIVLFVHMFGWPQGRYVVNLRGHHL